MKPAVSRIPLLVLCFATVFKVNAGTGALTTVAIIPPDVTHQPMAGVVPDGNGFLWGSTSFGPAHRNNGTIFKVNTTTGELAIVVDFGDNAKSGINGSAPHGDLVSDGSGSFWGTTDHGGSAGYGTVFKLNATTGEFTKLIDFTNNGEVNKGRNPTGSLVGDGRGAFWGTTSFGGANGFGTVFRLNTATGELTTVVSFSRSRGKTKGAQPMAGLTNDGMGNLWGTTFAGGAADLGTVYRINATTGEFTTMVEFGGIAPVRRADIPAPK